MINTRNRMSINNLNSYFQFFIFLSFRLIVYRRIFRSSTNYKSTTTNQILFPICKNKKLSNEFSSVVNKQKRTYMYKYIYNKYQLFYQQNRVHLLLLLVFFLYLFLLKIFFSQCTIFRIFLLVYRQLFNQSVNSFRNQKREKDQFRN